MRIEGERPDGVAPSAQSPATDRPRAARQDAGAQPQGANADRVEVSDDARFFSAAVQAAKEAPEVSATAVERARQKLLSGELGRDAERLADRLIDHLIR